MTFIFFYKKKGMFAQARVMPDVYTNSAPSPSKNNKPFINFNYRIFLGKSFFLKFFKLVNIVKPQILKSMGNVKPQSVKLVGIIKPQVFKIVPHILGWWGPLNLMFLN